MQWETLKDLKRNFHHLSWRPYVDGIDASQAADSSDTTDGYNIWTVLEQSKKKYDELLPLLVLLFILDLKNVVCSTESQKTEVPAHNI